MQDWDNIKVVGKRKPSIPNVLSKEWDEYLDLIWDLRQDKVFVPKGVYRYKSFEEANEWMERMILGEKPIAARPGQRT